jgi:nucleoside-diphosphate-sugar epimerase
VSVLVTGAEGFIGKHLCRQLGESFTVQGIDRSYGDLRDPATITRAFYDFHPAVCVHLAARVGRLYGEYDVLETVADNAGMTAAIAQACGHAGVRLVYASTSEVYGDRGDFECEEDDDLRVGRVHNVYGLSKRWGEEACRLYAPQGLTIWRISMPYGPGLPPGRGRAAIVNMLWQALRREPIPVHRGAERSWCWVADSVEAMRLTLARSGGVYNVGRDDQPTPMRQVAEFACELTGCSPSLIEEVEPPARQTVVKRLSTKKIRSLGWEPRVDLREGMVRLLPWVEWCERRGVAA